jgi:hypothetical protein
MYTLTLDLLYRQFFRLFIALFVTLIGFTVSQWIEGSVIIEGILESPSTVKMSGSSARALPWLTSWAVAIGVSFFWGLYAVRARGVVEACAHVGWPAFSADVSTWLICYLGFFILSLNALSSLPSSESSREPSKTALHRAESLPSMTFTNGPHRAVFKAPSVKAPSSIEPSTSTAPSTLERRRPLIISWRSTGAHRSDLKDPHSEFPPPIGSSVTSAERSPHHVVLLSRFGDLIIRLSVTTLLGLILIATFSKCGLASVWLCSLVSLTIERLL